MTFCPVDFPSKILVVFSTTISNHFQSRKGLLKCHDSRVIWQKEWEKFTAKQWSSAKEWPTLVCARGSSPPTHTHTHLTNKVPFSRFIAVGETEKRRHHRQHSTLCLQGDGAADTADGWGKQGEREGRLSHDKKLQGGRGEAECLGLNGVIKVQQGEQSEDINAVRWFNYTLKERVINAHEALLHSSRIPLSNFLKTMCALPFWYCSG